MTKYPETETTVEQGKTEMAFWERRKLKEAVTQLVTKRKPFAVAPEVDDLGRECWILTVDETNEIGGLAGRWSDA